MNRKICPHFGSPEDRETALEFAAEQNTCYKADPPGAVALEHQKDYCLSTLHSACPVYLTQRAVPLPPKVAAAPKAAAPLRLARPPRWMAITGALLALALLLGVSLALRLARPDAGRIVQTGGELPGDLVGGPSPVEQLLNGEGEVKAAPLGRPDCPLPSGWMAFTLQPTDTLGRIARLFGVSAEALRAANCLSEGQRVRPGETIYVPAPPEPTPTPAATASPTPVRGMVAPPPTAQPVAPTQAPLPTAAPTMLPSVAPTLPTVAPTLPPPLPTEPPGSGPITIDDSGRTVTLTCAGNEVTVSGNNNVITLLGTCARLTVTGNSNEIRLENPTEMDDQGNHNSIG